MPTAAASPARAGRGVRREEETAESAEAAAAAEKRASRREKAAAAAAAGWTVAVEEVEVEEVEGDEEGGDEADSAALFVVVDLANLALANLCCCLTPHFVGAAAATRPLRACDIAIERFFGACKMKTLFSTRTEKKKKLRISEKEK